MTTRWLQTLKNNILLLLGVIVISHNSYAAECNVPVCDIPGTIAILENETVDFRATFLGELYQKTKTNNKVPALRNLHEFGKLSYELQKKLGDPENVLAWSVFIREKSINDLIKFLPFQLEELKALYLETFEIPDLSLDRQQRIRFDTYQRWKVQIKTIMDTQLIFGLYSFISYTNQLSEENKDEEYILREAVTTLDLLGKRLSFLYPSYEGVFNIKTYCVPDAKQCGLGDLAANRLTILNSITDLGIFSGLFDDKAGEQNFMFYRSVIESFGTRLYTASEVLSTTGRPSELYVKLDDKQNIKGYVVSSRYPGTLRFEGAAVYSPIKFYVDEGVEQEKPIISGKFEGMIGEKKASIIIRQKKNKALIASMQVGGSNSGVIYDFSNGEYIEHRGIINLVGFPGQRVEPSKINIAYRKNEKGEYRWTGGFFTISGKFLSIELKRSAEIDQPSNEELNIFL